HRARALETVGLTADPCERPSRYRLPARLRGRERADGRRVPPGHPARPRGRRTDLLGLTAALDRLAPGQQVVSFADRQPAPHAVRLAYGQRVLEALVDDRASGAVALRRTL